VWVGQTLKDIFEDNVLDLMLSLETHFNREELTVFDVPVECTFEGEESPAFLDFVKYR
jgi:hypothetical protein